METENPYLDVKKRIEEQFNIVLADKPLIYKQTTNKHLMIWSAVIMEGYREETNPRRPILYSKHTLDQIIDAEDLLMETVGYQFRILPANELSSPRYHLDHTERTEFNRNFFHHTENDFTAHCGLIVPVGLMTKERDKHDICATCKRREHGRTDMKAEAT